MTRTSSQQQERCRAWLGAAYDGSQAEPLRSDIPGLITVGEFDRLVTRAARFLAAGLPRAHLLILPWEGHVWTAPCAPHIATVFFEAPERAPDTTCVDAIPPLEFVTVPGAQPAPGGGTHGSLELTRSEGGQSGDRKGSSFPLSLDTRHNRDRWNRIRLSRSLRELPGKPLELWTP